MKSAILICLFLFSIATESRHLQKRDHEHHSRLIHEIEKQVGKPTVEKLVLVMVSQDFSKCTLDEHLKLQAKIMEVVDNCVKHPEEADCKKSAMTLYHDTVCKEGDIGQLYPWITDCCGKEEGERIKCFWEHREDNEGAYIKPSIEDGCKEYQEHPLHLLNFFIHSVGATYTHLYPPAVLGFAMQYHQITGECCAVEDKKKCLFERMTQAKKLKLYVEEKHKQKCRIIKAFPERVTQVLTLVQVSQWFPKASFKDVEKLTLEMVHMKEDCCKGNAVECMMERMEVTEHICEAKDKLSSKLAPCCEKDLLERTPCIVALPHDEAEGSKDMKHYYEDAGVCEDYLKDKTTYLDHFTHDYARFHQESSTQSCMRVAKGYEQLLEKTCSSDSHEGLKEAPLLLAAAQKENEELLKQNCGGLAKLGFNDYLVHLLVRYVKKLPQVTTPTLVGMVAKMGKIGVHCCALADDKKQTCAEEKLDMLLGEMCEKETSTFINDKVHHCCVDSYPDRRPCMTKLDRDPSYVPPAFDATKLHFTNAMCDGSADEQLKHRLGLLVEFIKMKPNCEQGKLEKIVEEYRKTMGKCCAEEDHEHCFASEKQEIVKLATEA